MILPWLVWLSELSAGLRTRGSLVRFQVRSRAWVAGRVPCSGCARGNHTLMSVSLPKSLKKKRKGNDSDDEYNSNNKELLILTVNLCYCYPCFATIKIRLREVKDLTNIMQDILNKKIL